MTKKNAVMLRTTTHADESFAKGQVILGMDGGQFGDWKSAELVRDATDEEVATAKASTEASAASAAETDDKAAPKSKARTTA